MREEEPWEGRQKKEVKRKSRESRKKDEGEPADLLFALFASTALGIMLALIGQYPRPALTE